MSKGEENSLLINLSPDSNYGSVKYPSLPTASKKVVYCVHGKPSAGCCKVMEGEVIDMDPYNSQSMTPQGKENVDATDFVNKHCHRGQPGVDVRARRKLIIASILCVVFMIAEVIGGYISNSLAIASDAAHLLTDFASFMISLFSLWMANRPSTRKLSFGWYRAEVIGALTSVLMIWVVTGVLVYLAVQRVIGQEFEIEAGIMLITSGIGLIFNIVMGLTLHQHGHSHGKSESCAKDGTGKQNINVRAAYIHVIGDFLQSFGVFLAAIVIYFEPSWVLVDPICTFLFSILVLMTTFTIIKDVVMVLMEALPKGIDFNDVMNLLLAIEGVKRVHNLRIWALSMDKIAMSAHVAIDSNVNPQQVLVVASKNIHDKYNFFEMTLQIEEFQSAMEDCNQCKNPN